MANEAASLLDQLMGSHRNAVPGDNIKPLKFSDNEVCKYYLCGFCPCDLFTNTRADMGACPKLHDEKMRKDYEASGKKGEYGYEALFLRHLEDIIADLDRRIARGRARITRSANAKVQGDEEVTSERLGRINSQINNTLTQLEELGANGRVDEVREVMTLLEQLEKERDAERKSVNCWGPKTVAGYELDANDFHEKMELCDVCGSFLVIGDTQCRVDAHLLGKQHIGYARIRATVTELKLFEEERAATRREERRKRLSSRQSASPGRPQSKSPPKRSKSPRRRSRSPRRRSRSPRKRSRSPRKRSRSPRKRSRSPRKRSRSPRKRSRSPRKRSRSPRKRSRSPHKRSKSPRRRSRSPRRRSRSPRKRSRSPRKRSRSPKRSKGHRWKSHRSRSPRKRSSSPKSSEHSITTNNRGINTTQEQ